MNRNRRRKENLESNQLEDSKLWPLGYEGPPNWKLLKRHFLQNKLITKRQAVRIVSAARMVLKLEPNLIDLNHSITVVGDIHGQYFDLIRLIESTGCPSKTKYLFLGDYVDRGQFSCQVILLLYAIKINYPDRIWLLRGNHECRQLTQYFNFKAECKVKFDLYLYDMIMQSFDCLPLAAVIQQKFFACHAGISPDMSNFRQDIMKLHRFQENPRTGLQCDLLWSDPWDVDKMKYNPSIAFPKNDVRGCSFYYTIEAANDWLQKNDLVCIIRAHEAQVHGFKMFSNSMNKVNKEENFPQVITIFSAPNYCDCYGNKAAIITFDDNQLNVQQFSAVSHPYVLNDFVNCLSWSIPFVIDKVNAFMNELVAMNYDSKSSVKYELPFQIANLFNDPTSKCKTENNNRLSSNLLTEDEIDLIRQKILINARLFRAINLIRSHSKVCVELKTLLNGQAIPYNMLVAGDQALIEYKNFLEYTRFSS